MKQARLPAPGPVFGTRQSSAQALKVWVWPAAGAAAGWPAPVCATAGCEFTRAAESQMARTALLAGALGPLGPLHPERLTGQRGLSALVGYQAISPGGSGARLLQGFERRGEAGQRHGRLHHRLGINQVGQVQIRAGLELLQDVVGQGETAGADLLVADLDLRAVDGALVHLQADALLDVRGRRQQQDEKGLALRAYVPGTRDQLDLGRVVRIDHLMVDDTERPRLRGRALGRLGRRAVEGPGLEYLRLRLVGTRPSNAQGQNPDRGQRRNAPTPDPHVWSSDRIDCPARPSRARRNLPGRGPSCKPARMPVILRSDITIATRRQGRKSLEQDWGDFLNFALLRTLTARFASKAARGYARSGARRVAVFQIDPTRAD